MGRGVGHKRGSDWASLWLWCRLAAVAPIRPLAWEPPYAGGASLKRQQLKKKNKREKQLFVDVLVGEEKGIVYGDLVTVTVSSVPGSPQQSIGMATFYTLIEVNGHFQRGREDSRACRLTKEGLKKKKKKSSRHGTVVNESD